MNRSRLAAALLAFAFAVVVSLASASGLGGGAAFAQQVRPPVKGRSHRVKVDSSPQQAAVYWVAGSATNAKDYGIAGYTPITIKVPRGAVTFVVELQGFKPQTKAMDVKRSQTVNFTLERAPAVAKLDLQTTDGSATGADVKIDGMSKGTIPVVIELPAGRHQVDVNKQGFKEWTQWFDLAEGEHHTHDVALVRAEAPAGALLVTSDAGGDVYVDGVRKDVAPAIITGVPAGDHVIEVRRDGVPPWRQNVTVLSGQQVKVSAVFGAAAGTGSIRAIASEPDAQIFIDGEDKGRSPATANNVKPGDHIVEARKAKFKSVQQMVHVAQGDNAIVQLKMDLAPPDRPKAGLKVQSTVPNAEVFVDGSSLGRAPVDRNDLDPGKHYIVVHRDGYTDFKREVVLNENQYVALVADLSATGAVRVLSTPEGADVRIDGELIGKTPVSRDQIGAGDHVIEFRLKGYFDHKETMKVEGGREKVFSVDLKLIPTGPTPEQVAKRKGGMSSFGAKVNPVGGVTADFGSGYPYYLMARLTVGAFNTKPLGLDMGVEFTSFVEMNNLSVHARLQLVEAGPLSLATKANLGGGFGFNGRDSYFADFIGIASLAFSDVATVSATLRWSLWTDKFCPSVTQVQNGIKPEAYCGTAGAGDYDHSLFSKDPNSSRFGGSRLYLGFGVAAALDRYTSLFLQVEFLPAPDTFNYDIRQQFDDRYNGAMLGHDPFYYGQAGVSLKF
ncbi:MAG TPA: PEGA domain-containing protein [Polyangia bacterium]|nr:PEGA domain-containing protein [Polyangia bacterium]